jgi:hypothetical protein
MASDHPQDKHYSIYLLPTVTDESLYTLMPRFLDTVTNRKIKYLKLNDSKN